MLDALGHPDFQLANQFLGIILYVFQDLFNRLTIEYLVDMILTVLDRDMNSGGIAINTYISFTVETNLEVVSNLLKNLKAIQTSQ